MFKVAWKFFIRYFFDSDFRHKVARYRFFVESYTKKLWPDDHILRIKLVDITSSHYVFVIWHKPAEVMMRPSFRVDVVAFDPPSNQVSLLNNSTPIRKRRAIALETKTWLGVGFAVVFS